MVQLDLDILVPISLLVKCIQCVFPDIKNPMSRNISIISKMDEDHTEFTDTANQNTFDGTVIDEITEPVIGHPHS